MRKGILVLMLLIEFGQANAKVFYASDYGCVTGGADNSSQFRRIADDINKEKGGTLVFEKDKQYYVEITPDYSSGHTAEPSTNATAFLFQHCGYLKIDLNGSAIIIKANNSTKYAIFRLLDCASFSIFNGTIRGDADVHDYAVATYGGKRENSTHEWGHGIIVNGSKGVIENLCIANMTGDGIKTGSYRSKKGTYHAKVTIRDVEIFNCRRNGIACLSSCGIKIQRTHIHDIGSFGKVKGTSPEAGIDLEYEDGVGDDGCVTIDGCHIYRCSQKVISASNTTPPTPKNLTVKNCTLEGGSFQISNAKVSGKMRVMNCTVKECSLNLGKVVVSNCSFTLPKSISYVSGTTYKKCTFIGQLEGFTSPYGCSLAGYNDQLALFEKCSFKDVRGPNTRSQAYQGFSGFNFPLKASFIECSFDNCSFVRGNPKYQSSFTFRKSQFKNKCMFFNEDGDVAIEFDRCALENVETYQTQIGRFILRSSRLLQNDETMLTPMLQFGDNTFEKSTIEDNADFTSQMRKHSIKSMKVRATNSELHLRRGSAATTGVRLTSCTVTGIKESEFAGEAHNTKYKNR